MNIMIFADQESKLLYEYYDPERMKDIDLIISCGDLPPEYLTFFATLCHAPLLYVKGNHDGKYEQKPPEGCICIEDNIYVYKGVRILGLGGSMEYIPGASNQYTEWRMRARIRKLWWKLWWHKGFDILVTHAPAYKLNDMEDLPHRGFKANYGKGFKRKDVYGTTRVINGYEFYVIEYPGEPVVSAEKKENTSA